MSNIDSLRDSMLCVNCLYARRSTEPEENTGPDKYRPVFRLDPKVPADLPIAPRILPLRRPAS
ncbi:MAG TPA: non-oxidative hydroxyarylic acid decarboxylases subunit D [Bryobacteraceae bacterium]|nr:non-oxidative hydroxyarylic acid decarboxylases subunit D [Bryobacteraceae bacterium]